MNIRSNFLDWTKQLDPNLVSVVVCTYNRPFWLDATLSTLKDCAKKLEEIPDIKMEVIIVDDGSTKVHEHIIRNDSFCQRLTSIQVIKLPKNSGTVSVPRNIGISYANGAYIAPVDDDCLSFEDKFLKLVPVLKESDAVLVYGNRVEASSSAAIPENIVIKKHVRMPNHNKYDCGIDNGQFIYKSAVYAGINPVYAINACDWELYKQIANLGDFKYVDISTSIYVWHESQNNISLTPKERRVNPLNVLGGFLDYFKHGPHKEYAKILVDKGV